MDDDQKIVMREKENIENETRTNVFEKVEKKLNQSQKINITKAVLKDLGGDDNTSININYQPIMIVNEGTNAEEREGMLIPFSELSELVWTLLEQLPNPKIQNLRKLAIVTVIERLQSTKKAAEYLNMQRTYMSRIMTEARDDGLFQDNLQYHKVKTQGKRTDREQGDVIEAECLQLNVQKT